jgi:chromosome segregation ATPase
MYDRITALSTPSNNDIGKDQAALLAHTIMGLRHHITSLKQSLGDAQRELQNARENDANKQRQINEARTRETALKNELRDKEAARSLLDSQLSQLQDRLNRLQATQATSANERKQLQEQQQRLQTEINRITPLLQQADSASRNLQSQLRAAEAREATEKTAKEQAETRATTLQTQLQTEKNGRRDNSVQCNADKRDLQRQLSEATAQIASHGASTTEAERRVREAMQSVNEMEVLLNDLIERYERLRGSYQGMFKTVMQQTPTPLQNDNIKEIRNIVKAHPTNPNAISQALLDSTNPRLKAVFNITTGGSKSRRAKQGPKAGSKRKSAQSKRKPRSTKKSSTTKRKSPAPKSKRRL